MNKIEVKIENLRLREQPSLNGKTLGFVSKGIHEYIEKTNNDNYLWYHIENGWCAHIKGDVIEIEDKDIEELRKEVAELKSELEVLKELCVASNNIKKLKALTQEEYNKITKEDNELYVIK